MTAGADLNQPPGPGQDELKFIQTYLSKGGQVSLVLRVRTLTTNLDAPDEGVRPQLAGGYARTPNAITPAELPDLLPGAEHGQRRRLRHGEPRRTWPW